MDTKSQKAFKKNLNIKMWKIIFCSFIFFPFVYDFGFAFDQIKVTTWNIEHLGSGGRGFGGGYGGGSLDLRTDEQLKAIGIFIRDTLKSDVVALQEIGITYVDGQSRSSELDKITKEMGEEWKYYLPPKHRNHHDGSMYVGFLWNNNRIRGLQLKPFYLPNLELAGKALFDRTPVIGYFEIIKDEVTKNDFLLVNVHLASGQHNDENHLIAMTLIQYRLGKALKSLKITESDRIILGDFNDNPYSKYDSGRARYTNALYHHMGYKGYFDFVTPDFHSTRMDQNLTSIIDHVLINKSAKRHVVQDTKAEIWLPANAPESFPAWRETYSDHFPISVDIKVQSDDDKDWDEGS